MELWNEILRLSIIGLSNAGFPENSKMALKRLGLNSKSDTLLLQEGIAALSALEKWTISNHRPNTEAAIFAPLEDHYESSNPTLAKVLKRILHLEEYEILKEYFYLCNKHKLSILAEFWPQFFEMSLTDPAFFDLLNPVINSRAEWLMQINPNWQSLLVDRDSDAELSFHISVQTYKRLKKQDTEVAKSYLLDFWDQFIIPEQRQILSIIKKTIRPEDLDVLLNLSNRNETAIKPYLNQIILLFPESALSVSASKFIENYTYYHLGFELIEDQDMFKDSEWAKGMDTLIQIENPYQHRYFNVIAHLHPIALQEQFDLTLDSFFLRARLSSLKNLWFEALIHASLLHKEQRWLKAILELSYQYPDQFKIQEDYFQSIVQKITPDYFKKKSLALLQSEKPLSQNKAFLDLIFYSDHFWSKSLSILFFEKLSSWMHQAENGLQKMWKFEKYLKRAALKSDPQLGKPIFELVQPILNNSYRFSAAFEQFFLLLEIRTDLRIGFEKNKK